MKVYILTEYDYGGEEVVYLGAYTESAFNRKKEEMIENLKKEYEKKKMEESQKYNASSIERKLLASEIDKLNILINKAKEEGDEKQYRALRRERRKISRRLQNIAIEYRNNIYQLEVKLEYESRNIMKNFGDRRIHIEELDVIE